MNKILLFSIKLFISILFLFIVLQKVDIKASIAILKNTDFLYSLIPLWLSLFSAFLRSWRFSLISQSYNPKANYQNIVIPYITAISLSAFLPLGEDLFKIFGNKDRWGMASRLSGALIDRITGFIGLIIVVFIGCIILMTIGDDKSQFVVWQVGAVLLLLVALGSAMYFTGRFWAKIANGNLKSPILNRVGRSIDLAFYESKVLFADKKNILRKVTLISISLHVFVSVPIFIFAWRAVGGDYSHAMIFFSFVPIVMIFQSLPISFLGLGVRDLSFLYLMQTVESNSERIIATTILILLTRVISCLILLLTGTFILGNKRIENKALH